MTGKDPKDMTASELMRYLHDRNSSCSCFMCNKVLNIEECGEHVCHDVFEALADKIDAELAQARELSLRQGAELWAKANGWPGFREGEDFGQWLDRCAFPKPMDEHGEPVQIGEHIEDKVRGDIDVSRISYTANGHYFNNSHNSVGTSIAKRITYAPGERVERPAPEVLGADGKPVVEGETVWDMESGIEGVVDNFQFIYGQDVTANIKCPDDGEFYNFNADRLTHTPPDTQERINRDAALPAREYYARHIGHDVAEKGAVEVHAAVTAHLLKRQRELDAKGAI